MLTLWRRHEQSCKHLTKGRAYLKCQCPVWADGMLNGQRFRKSMQTRDWARGQRLAGKLEDEALSTRRIRKSVESATAAFLDSVTGEVATFKKYARIANHMDAFAAGNGIGFVDEFSVERLDAYRTDRLKTLGALTWGKELQTLRQFFTFWMDREWCEKNPAARMKIPTVEEADREPYTDEEVIAILAACNNFGRTSYERRRAAGMVTLLWRCGLRISDVAFFKRASVKDGKISTRAKKNRAPLWFDLQPDLSAALECLPVPEGAPADGGEYFFWNGHGSSDSHLRSIARTLKAVFRKSGVERALAHRFRHTLATKILVEGGSIEDAANILGDTPAIIEKHYIKFSQQYRDRLSSVMQRTWAGENGTLLAREEFVGLSGMESRGGMVAREGIEPPTRGFSVRCSTS